MYPKPKSNIKDLDGNIFIKIRDTLNTAPDNRNWRKLVEVASEDSKDFYYRLDQVAAFGNYVLSANSGGPATYVLNDLGGRGCTVEQLTKYLNILELENLVLLLKQKEPLRILKQPECSRNVLEGECLNISVRATGLPYPRYLWYHYRNGTELVRLEDQTEATLKIPKIRLHEAGHYCCQIHNGSSSGVLQSDYCEVLVKPNPNAQFEDERQEQRHSSPSSYANNNNAQYNPVSRTRQNHPQQPFENPEASPAVTLQPVIIHQPTSVKEDENSNIRFLVVVEGQSPLQYTWFKDGMMFKETLENVLELNNLTIQSAGVFRCCVSNAYGGAATNPFSLQINRREQAAYADQSCKIGLQPQSVTVNFGGTAKFRCEAKGGYSHTYQWYRDGESLPGANSNEYEIKICDDIRQYPGDYHCEIITSGRKLVSHPARLKIVMPDEPQFRATDKVALLIGNSDYKNAETLAATGSDIQKLTDVLRKLKFKVVSLLNLTLIEMESAIEEFCQLLGSGVYGFFYFCGHGFEEYSKQYMVPYDAPAGFTQNNCLCLTNVVTNISKEDPALICFVLDMCRARNIVPGDLPRRDAEIDERHIRGNQMYLFATTFGLQAYETATKGLLVEELAKEIVKEQCVETAFINVKRAFNSLEILKASGKCQLPDTRGNLNEARCLTDPVYPDDFTQEFNRRRMRWAEICRKPDLQKISLDQLGAPGIVIELDFQETACNILTVFMSVQHDERITRKCTTEIFKVPTYVSKQKPQDILPGKTQTTILDIQRLRGNLEIVIRVESVPVTGEERTFYLTCDLGQPLCAKLKLYQSRNRTPIEDDENEIGGRG